MSKTRLIKRLKWYYPTERFHTFCTFPMLLIYSLLVNPFIDVVLLSYGLIVCIIILYQGQHYWKIKLDGLLGNAIDQHSSLHFFLKSKKLNIILMSIMPMILVLQLYLNEWNFKLNNKFLWGILANLFAVLEHINYYNTQLMVDNKYDLCYLIRNRKLKKASLAKDLIEGKF